MNNKELNLITKIILLMCCTFPSISIANDRYLEEEIFRANLERINFDSTGMYAAKFRAIVLNETNTDQSRRQSKEIIIDKVKKEVNAEALELYQPLFESHWNQSNIPSDITLDNHFMQSYYIQFISRQETKELTKDKRKLKFGYSPFVYFSKPAFNTSKDLALIYIENHELEEGSGYYLVLKKENGRWSQVYWLIDWIS